MSNLFFKLVNEYSCSKAKRLNVFVVSVLCFFIISNQLIANNSFNPSFNSNFEKANCLAVLTEFPEDLQFYARDIVTNKAIIPISGSVTNLSDSINIEVLREGQLYDQKGFKPTLNLNFNLTAEIDAELANYTFNLYVINSAGSVTLCNTAINVVAGDAYVITGQSNAEAKTWNGSSSENTSDFIRVFATGTEFEDTLTNNLEWFIGQGDGDRNSLGNTGQWGFHLGKQLVDNYQIPICIFNGARSGWRINLFQKNIQNPEDLTTNYGRLLYRTNQSNLTDKVRAILWYQGESDSGGTSPLSINDYKQAFTNLHNDWKSDFISTEKYYITQIRNGCDRTPEESVIIQEALRQLADDIPNTTLMSTRGIINDGCHFPYIAGYKELGKRYFRLLSNDLYGTNFSAVQSPNIDKAYFTSSTELVIETKSLDNLVWEAGVHTYFSLEGSTAQIIGGTTSANKIILQLDVSGLTATGLTFVDEQIITQPNIINNEGLGLVAFYNFPLLPCVVTAACNDGDSCTFNDQLNSNCQCTGEPKPNLNITTTVNNESGFQANDGSATVQVNGNFAPYSILWSTGATTFTINNLAPVLYTYTITDVDGCVAAEESLNIDAIICNTITTDVAIVNETCENQANGLLIIRNISNGTAPYTVLWSTGVTGTVTNNLTTGNYQLTITDALGCPFQNSYSISADNYIQASFNINNVSSATLNDGSIEVIPSGGDTPYAYNWSNGSSNQTLNNIGVGTYSVTVTDANGCSEFFDQLTVDNNCVASIVQQNNPPINSQVYQASQYIQSNGRANANEQVSFKAGEYIELTNSFEVIIGAEFEALIYGCVE